MDITYVWSKFKGLNNLVNQAIKDAEMVRSNAYYNDQGKRDGYDKIKDKLYNTYSEMLTNGIKACDSLIADKTEGYRITRLNDIKDDTKRLYYLNYYTNLVEKMSVAEIVDFMLKDDNLLNTVYRDCFKTRAASYKKDLQPLDGISYKIDEIMSAINLENIDGIKEYQDIKLILQNFSTGLLTDYNKVYYNLENGDFETSQNMTEILQLERPHFTTWNY